MGNSGGSGTFMIVLLLVLVTLGAGYLFRDHSAQQARLEEVEIEATAQIAALTGKEKELQEQLAQKDAQLAEKDSLLAEKDQRIAELTRQLAEAHKANTDLASRATQAETERDLTKVALGEAIRQAELAEAEQNQPDQRGAEYQAQINDLSNQVLSLQNQLDEANQALAEARAQLNVIPVTSGVFKAESLGAPLLIVVGLSLFGFAAMFSFRSLIEGSRNHEQDDEEIVLVKMKRSEARRLAQNRRRS